MYRNYGPSEPQNNVENNHITIPVYMPLMHQQQVCDQSKIPYKTQHEYVPMYHPQVHPNYEAVSLYFLKF